MHSPKIAHLHKLCTLTLKKLAAAQVLPVYTVQPKKLGQFGRKDSARMLAVFCISGFEKKLIGFCSFFYMKLIWILDLGVLF